MLADRWVVGFDLDGTLIDSRSDIRAAIRTVLAAHGHPAEIADQVRIGPPMAEMLRPFLPLAEAELRDLTLAFRQAYDHSNFPQTTIYPGVLVLLDWLKAFDIPMFIATNKPESATRPVLNQLRLDGYFHRCFTPTSLALTRVTKADLLGLAVQNFGPPRHLVFVGDSPEDISATRPISPNSIAVSYGYSTVAQLLEMRPGHLAATPGEVKSILASLFSDNLEE